MRNRLIAIAFLVVAAAYPIVFQELGNSFMIHIGVVVGINIILALGMNVILGYTGLLNLGFSAYFAMGAYASMLLAIHFGLGFIPNLIITALLTGVWGVLLGIPVLRLKGDYYAIVTLGLVEITRIVLNNLDGVTNGPRGLELPSGAAIPMPHAIFGYALSPNARFFYLTLILAFVSIFALKRIERSRIGMTWIAVKDDEIAAEAMGVNLALTKTMAAGIGCLFAGVAGTIYTYKMSFITPEAFDFMYSVLILCMIVLGGMGSIPGGILGAALIIGIPEGLRMALGASFTDYRMLVFGAAMIVIVVFRAQGILPPSRPSYAIPKKTEEAAG